MVMLDAVGPQPVADNLFPAQMRKFLIEKGSLLHRENRFFASLEEAATARETGGMRPDAARLIAQRNLRACAQGYTWTTDPRLRGASAVKLTPGQVDATLGALVMPTLLLLAEQGHGGRHEAMHQLARRAIPELQMAYLPGGHHFHMEQPEVQAVADIIAEFLR
jgi:pimeloyl-ACP methyl ester carboxylesterase